EYVCYGSVVSSVNAGQLWRKFDHTKSPHPQEYIYDPLNRIREIRQQQPDGSISTSRFTYDAIGNLKSMAGISGTYQDEGRPQLRSSVASHSVGYDANGNQTSRTGPTIPLGQQTIEYTPFDLAAHITAGTVDLQQETHLVYDANQTRVP